MPLLQSQTISIDFESFADGTAVTTQVTGLTFRNTGILTSGVSLNDFEFPAHSGQNIAYDSGGAITITFSPPVKIFNAYFNYRTTLTLTALNGSNVTVATSHSSFANNLKVSGVAGSAVNEVIQVAAPGISSVTITGDPAGSSFSMDDVSTVGLSSYLMGDTFPHTTDANNSFGDGSLNTLDLLDMLRAATNVPGFTPKTCSDRFDSMDVFPVDATGQRGGDGLINTLDLIAELKRVTNADPLRPARTARNLTCPDVSTQSVNANGASSGQIIVGSPLNGERAIYLLPDNDLSLTGLSIGLGVGQVQLSFRPAAEVSPSLTDTDLPGTLALAWLSPLHFTGGERALLGYVKVGSTRSPVKLFSAAGDTTDGSSVTFRLQDRVTQ